MVNTYSNVLTFVQEQVVQGTPNIRDKLWRLTRDHFAFHSISTIALNGSSALNNPLLKELLATGYVYRTALGLRALLIGKRNDDISIEKVLIFLKKHRYCITRNEVLLHQGLPFEGDDLEMEARDAISQATKKRSGWIERSRYQDWLDVQKRFDNISQVQPKIRSPNDTISDIWINTVDLKRCAALDLIKEFTDKSIAHVTTRSSSIPYSHFDQALELTWSAFNDITREILGTTVMPTGSWHNDMLMQLDLPVLPKDLHEKYREEIRSLDAEIVKRFSQGAIQIN